MTGFEIALVAILVACILASGFFSGSETAIVATPKERVHQLANKGTRGEKLAELVQEYDRTLGVLLVANNFVNILAASIGTVLTVDFLSEITSPQGAEAWGPWISTVALTSLILVIGEITPKTLAANHPDRFAMAVAPTIWWLGVLIRYPARFFIWVSRGLLRLLGFSPSSMTIATEQDILALAAISEAAGEIESAEREILESLFELADRPVRDIMTPRLEVVALEEGITPDQARKAAARYGHSRFPVIPPGGTLDDLIGILSSKDLLRSENVDSIDRLIREPVFVPESTPILTALQRLRNQGAGLAVVLDEHGGADGVVTIKDLISELVGDLTDEYDPKEPSAFRIGSRAWVVDGRFPVEELDNTIGAELPKGEYTSIAGLLLAQTGRIPEAGDAIIVDGLLFTVLRMDRRRIDRIRVELAPESGQEETD